ncbi:hypothetical protein [Tessaracoccus massiliensis]|uniref:hypothetical protein n=1 Tax=Tessaracoccus massiliensis TaxID=1522311 RepID=UPI00058B16DC|nr:hypothetical protein [Tessaracoccus massiliensis]
MSWLHREAMHRRLSGVPLGIAEWASVVLTAHRALSAANREPDPGVRAAAGLARLHYQSGGWWNDTKLVASARSVGDSSREDLRSAFQLLTRDAAVSATNEDQATLLRALDHRLMGSRVKGVDEWGDALAAVAPAAVHVAAATAIAHQQHRFLRRAEQLLDAVDISPDSAVHPERLRLLTRTAVSRWQELVRGLPTLSGPQAALPPNVQTTLASGARAATASIRSAPGSSPAEQLGLLAARTGTRRRGTCEPLTNPGRFIYRLAHTRARHHTPTTGA